MGGTSGLSPLSRHGCYLLKGARKQRIVDEKRKRKRPSMRHSSDEGRGGSFTAREPGSHRTRRLKAWLRAGKTVELRDRGQPHGCDMGNCLIYQNNGKEEPPPQRASDSSRAAATGWARQGESHYVVQISICPLPLSRRRPARDSSITRRDTPCSRPWPGRRRARNSAPPHAKRDRCPR